MSEKPTETRTLRVTGHGVCAYVIFGRWWGKWYIKEAAPYLLAVLKHTVAEDVGKTLKAKGFEYEWLPKDND